MTIRTRPILVFLASLGCAGCAAETATVAPPSAGLGGGDVPHIDAVTFKPQPTGSDLVEPELHFHAVNGDVQFVHQTVVETTGPSFKVNSGPVDAPSGKQKLGAVYSTSLRCGPGAYRVKIRAYLIDREGDHSNTVDYTVHCNGG